MELKHLNNDTEATVNFMEKHGWMGHVEHITDKFKLFLTVDELFICSMIITENGHRVFSHLTD